MAFRDRALVYQIDHFVTTAWRSIKPHESGDANESKAGRGM